MTKVKMWSGKDKLKYIFLTQIVNFVKNIKMERLTQIGMTGMVVYTIDRIMSLFSHLNVTIEE